MYNIGTTLINFFSFSLIKELLKNIIFVTNSVYAIERVIDKIIFDDFLQVWFDPEDLYAAWDLLILSADQYKNNSLYQ